MEWTAALKLERRKRDSPAELPARISLALDPGYGRVGKGEFRR